MSHSCGCWYQIPPPGPRKEFLPQVDVNAHTTILSTTSRTSLKQTFINPSSKDAIKEAKYTFPLYDSVSIVGFTCHIGDRVIRGVVKEKHDARAEYKAAVEKGETAGLMEQLPEASDVFTTRLGNIPADGKVVVEVTYLGELQHDAQVDGVRFTIPRNVASRYGVVSDNDSWMSKTAHTLARDGGVNITVDVEVDKGSNVQNIQSTTDSVVVLPGRTSTMSEDVFEPHYASASLSLSSEAATRSHGRDFVLLIKAKEQETPRAFLETHPSIPNQKAVMASLTPKFNLPSISPEIVLVIDRSGSMRSKIQTLKTALNLFLKSLPVGVKLNLCSFGSRFEFLWDKSKTLDDGTFPQVSNYIQSIQANFGGTEMYKPIAETVERRFKDLELEVLLLTDGEIWGQTELFELINKSASDNSVRFFSLGIGHGASNALIQGVARAGKGFAQSVNEDEQMDKKVVRMLKGALTPHISDYRAEIEYENDGDEFDFEMVDGSSANTITVDSISAPDDPEEDVVMETEGEKDKQAPISLFDDSYKEPEIESIGSGATGSNRFKNLPPMDPPKKMQVPYNMPHLFPFSRTSLYVLLSEETSHRTPKSLVIRGTSKHGPLVLTIPIQDIGRGETIHQLAARKLGIELEEGRGWIYDAKDKTGELMKDIHEGKWDLIVAREAVRIGLQFQVAGKWCSFVAVEKDEDVTSQYNGPDWETDDTFQGGQRALKVGSISDTSRSGARFSAGLMSKKKKSGPPPPPSAAASAPAPARQMMQMQQCAAVSSGADPTDDSELSFADDSQGKIHEIISHQIFSGSWDWNGKVFALIGVNEEDLKKKIPWSAVVEEDGDRTLSSMRSTVIATLAVIAYFRTQAKDEEDIWSLVVDKAIGWVKGRLDQLERDGVAKRKYESDEDLVEFVSRTLFGVGE